MSLIDPRDMLLIATVPIFISIAILNYLRHKRAKRLKEKTQQQIDYIRHVLKQAQDGRRLLYIHFQDSNIKKGELSLEIEGIKKHQIYCNVANGSIGPACINQPVTVFFYLGKQDNLRFYSFQSQIEHLKPTTKHIELSLTLPQNLGNDQRRQMLRFSPTPELIESLEVWVGQKSTEEVPGEATINWIVLPAKAYFLQDISAGGIKLHVREKHIDSELLKINNLFLIKLAIKQYKKIQADKPGAELFVNLVLVGSCVNISQHINQITKVKYLAIGIMFRRFAKPGLENKLAWQNVDTKQGVPILVSWILDNHYAQQRSSQH